MHKLAVGYKHVFFVLMQPPLTVKLRAGMPEAALRETKTIGIIKVKVMIKL